MKKILSLVLVVAMLLSVAPMTWAAEQDVGTATKPMHYASLVLKDSIAINFKSTRAWLEAEDVTKAEFTMGGEVVQTIEGIPAGDSALAVFSFTKLTPAQMAEDVTLSYYAGETLVKTLTSSVLDYCTDACADADESPLLKTALVDMLNYGAAAMTYNNETVDADLQTALTTYASYATTTEPTLSNKTALTGDEGDVKWLAAGLNLKDSVTLRFKFSTPEADGLTLKLTSNGQTWEITNFYPVEGEEGNYYAYFNGLNPAQLRQLVYGEFYAEGAAVSNKLTYSVESYAAADDGADANLTALTKTLMTYGDSVYTWAYTYLVGNDLTYIEAEDVILYQDVDATVLNDTTPLTKPVVTVMQDENASGGKVAKLDWSGRFANGTVTGETDLTKNPAHLSFNVRAEETGYYFVWVRYHAAANAPTVSSYVDGNLFRHGAATTSTGWQYEEMGDTDYNSNVATAENGYVWYRIAVCNWTAGNTYSVRLRGRDGGISYDKFLVTTDVSFAPHMGDLTTVEPEQVVEAENVYNDPMLTDIGTSSDITYVQTEDQYSNNDLFLNNSVAPSVGFKVTADVPGTYYVWGKFVNSGTLYSSISGSASEYVYVYWTKGQNSLPYDDTTGWYAIGKYTVTEAGEVIYVRLYGRTGTNRIDQFMVTNGAVAPHDHVYSEEWSSDADYHWYACTITGCTQVTDKAEHSYDNDTDADCNTCGAIRHIHTYSDTWTTDDTHHWHAATCGCADLTSEYGEHDFTTGTCPTCGKVDFYTVTGAGGLYIEAENATLFEGKDSTFDSKIPVTILDDANASGGKTVQLGDGTNGQSATSNNATGYPAHISFKVKAATDLNIRIFVKAKEWSDADNVGSNILWMYNKEGATDMNWTYFETNDGTNYKWYYKDITLKAGEVYTFGFRARHQYIIIDKFCVSYKSYTPV